MRDRSERRWNQIACEKSAEAFFQAACLLEQSVPEFLDKMVAPYAVNLSFACELWLKHIICSCSEGHRNLRTHDLKELFEKIKECDSELANRIEDEYVKELNNPRLLSLNEFLTENKNVFEDFRYMHEKNSDMKLYVSNLGAFCRSLRVCSSFDI